MKLPIKSLKNHRHQASQLAIKNAVNIDKSSPLRASKPLSISDYIRLFFSSPANIVASRLLIITLLLGFLIKVAGWLAGEIQAQNLIAIVVLAVPVSLLAYKVNKNSKIACFIYVLLAFYMPFYLIDTKIPNLYAALDFWQSMLLNLIGGSLLVKSWLMRKKPV